MSRRANDDFGFWIADFGLKRGIQNPKSKIQNGIAVVILLTMFCLCGCGSVEPVVKIGLVAPFEGRYRPIGYDVIYSGRLAVRQVNQAGGVGDYRVALVALDDSGNAELAAEVAASLAIDPGVVAVIGHWRPATTEAAGPIYAEAGLPYIAAAGLETVNPAGLPAEFRLAYEAVTPFDETPGEYAGPAYTAFETVLAALATAEAEYGRIDRATIMEVWEP
jgi:hypothetical protein